ncbi:MAG TPA: outer membrane beta-barrel protein [Gemmatimonadales bacterium]|nr:outer membrane beta-barrel protein [Gemmatimonadales bacterium]
MRAVACLLVLIGLAASRAVAQNPPPSDQPVTLDAPSGDVQPLTGENEHQLSITGFGVGGYTLDGKTHDNSFAAGKVAVALFRELTDNLYVFGQLTTSISAPAAPGEEASTETEIDNLLVSFTPKSLSSLNLTLGTLDAPIGFERDDEVLLLTPTTSFNFELARPSKLTGLFATYALSRKVDLTGLVANGWDSPLDPNHGKTVGARLGFLPTERSSIGFSTLYGSEGDTDATNDRLLLNADYAFEPNRDWLVAGEANYGKDIDLPDGGGNASWSGATLLVHRRLDRHWGVAARAEVMDDKDGARTGQPQTLTSYVIAPIYSIGVGREGIFANITHTTYRIPRFQLRGEVRLNHSDVPFFETETGLSQWGVQYTLQLVTTF